MGNNQEWIALMGKRISTHYAIMITGIVYIVVFGLIAYYFGMNIYNVIREYIGEVKKRENATSGAPKTALGSKDADNEHYQNDSEEKAYGDPDHDKFSRKVEEMKSKYSQYNKTVAELTKKYQKLVPDVLDVDKVFDRKHDNY